MAGGGDIYKRLTIVLSVNDAATAQLSTVSSTLRSFTGVTQQASGQLAKLSHRFAQVGRALVSFLVIRTIGVQFGKFIRLMFEGNQVLEKATTSLERLGGSLGFAQKQIEYIRKTAMRAPFDFQSILQASRLLVAYGKDLQTYLPVLLDWAAALGATSGELEGYAAAMGKIMAGSPYVLRILTTRAVGLDQWKAALEATNTALPKSERFAQALTIALKRFEGQAVILAKTMAGLRTNIRDVWVEISREVGLSMFARVRTALFEVYDGLRDIADNQREALYEIGDIFGQWAARIITIVKRAGQLRGVFDKMLAVAKHLAVFVIGRSLVMAFVRVGLRIQAAVIALTAMSVIARTVHIAMSALSIAAGLIAVHFMKAKMAAIDFQIAVGDLGAAVIVLEDFMESDEKVFTREQLATLRAYEQGIRKVNTTLYATTAVVDRWADDNTKLVISIQDWKNLFADLRDDVPWDKEIFDRLRNYAYEAEVVLERALGDDTWAERVNAALNAINEMEKGVAKGIKPDAGVYRAQILNIMTAMTQIEPVLDQWREQSLVIAASNKSVAESYETQEVALRAMALIMQDYEAHQLGIASAADDTADATIRRLKAEAGGLVDPDFGMSGWITLYQNIATVQADVRKAQEAATKLRAEGFSTLVEEWEYTTRIARLRSELAGNTREYATALSGVIAQIGALQEQPLLFTPKEWDKLVELALQLKVELKGLVAVQDELAFSTYAAFTLIQQAVNPLVSAVGSIADGADAMHQAFANAVKGMGKWALQLIAQLTTMVILMSIFNLASGGSTGWLGALKAVLGGDITSAAGRVGFGTKGHSLAFAGGGTDPEFGGITPRTQVQPQGRSGNMIIMYGDVLDGEGFMRKVDEANYALEKRKGGRR
ncbi:MAG: hypothetical protein KOO60_11030 [Gemmatimonadales bacterium]|nr:hypothetical protein [Gemmatimonadales bacterium]